MARPFPHCISGTLCAILIICPTRHPRRRARPPLQRRCPGEWCGASRRRSISGLPCGGDEPPYGTSGGPGEDRGAQRTVARRPGISQGLCGAGRNTFHHARSQDLFSRTQKYIPGGVNSPVRSFRSVEGVPRFIARGSGCHVWDIDGNSYVDYLCSWGPLILGHAHPEVVGVLREAIEGGTTFGAPVPRKRSWPSSSAAGPSPRWRWYAWSTRERKPA